MHIHNAHMELQTRRVGGRGRAETREDGRLTCAENEHVRECVLPDGGGGDDAGQGGVKFAFVVVSVAVAVQSSPVDP
jgi:hypothetical protein